MDDPATNLAQNIRQLREARSLSQQQCSKLSDMPRPTWANLESGSANPTLSVLLKVSAALQVSVEELIRPPRAACQLYRAGTLPQRVRSGCIVRQLVPDSIIGIQIERLEMPPRSTMTGVPHTTGTREYLVCEQGKIKLVAGGESWQLDAGDVIAFRGDQKHSYRNPTHARSVAYSVIALSPT